MLSITEYSYKLRRYKYIFFTQRKLRREIQGSAPLNIIIGAGTTTYAGWIATDLPFFNILKSGDWQFLFKNRKIDHILAEHVFEHLTEEQVRQALSYIFFQLKRQGSFRIALPDAFHPDKQYIEAVKPGGWDAGADDHKSFWNYQSIGKVAKETGFQVRELEYFNENGVFVSTSYSNTEGYIMRSKLNKFDYAPIPGYTSLIVDLIKP
jgi:predicted SAM-dependent methyltransferase